MSISRIENHFLEAEKILKEFILSGEIKNIETAGKLMVSSLKKGSKIISCGNGGSMSDAIHFAEELSGKYRENRKAIPAMAISDPGYLSCVSNDFGYAQVFSRFIEGIGNTNDILLAISTSGNSENILKAIDTAREKGMKVVGLTGKNGGKMGKLCDVEIRAPYSQYADRAQEIHIKIIHSMIDYIETNF
ncbi:MAG: D-sedoheptulose 7-phosphate isomerase [Bacteroidetes bacterium]|nr:D-sedoheptulose 7-phosphate isomerase [Bacteroidota bacterium]